MGMLTTVYRRTDSTSAEPRGAQPRLIRRPFSEVMLNPPTPTPFAAGEVMGRMWGAESWVPAGGTAGGPPLNDAPTDGFTYGRLDAAWSTALNLMGGTMGGYIVLNADPRPISPLDAATKQYVDDQVANGTYRGAWQVAANTPVLNPPVPAPVNGDRWLCVTAVAATPENPPAGMPGLPITTQLSDGDMIIWSALQNSWGIIRSGGLTRPVADDLYVNVTGDTMAGALIVRDPPSLNFEAVHKQYVDQRIFADVVGAGTWGRIVGGWQRGVALAGDAMTGPLLLSRDPVLPMEAVTLQFIADRVIDAPGPPGIYGRTAGAWERSIPLAGDVMTGLLTLSGDPTLPLHPVTLRYLQTILAGELLAYVQKAGDTMTGDLILNRDPVSNPQAATKQYVDIEVGNRLTQAQADARYVNLTGDTMIGALVLVPGQQTLAAHAATRGQAILRTGGVDGIMTGKLTLSAANQTLPTDAATRGQAILRTGGADGLMTGKLTLVPAQQVQDADAAYIGMVNAGLNDRVLKVGDLMSGPIIWDAAVIDATSDPGTLVTKAYVDALNPPGGGLTEPEADLLYVNLIGDTMTGPLRFTDIPGAAEAIVITRSLLQLYSSDIRAEDGRIGANNYVCWEDGGGFFFGQQIGINDGGLYKRINDGLVLRQSSGDQRPQVESNDGNERWEIVDARGGTFHRAGFANIGGQPLNWIDDGAAPDLARIYGSRATNSDSQGAFVIQVHDGQAWQTALRTRQRAGPDPLPRVELVAEPVEPQDAVTKAYVDAVSGGGLVPIGMTPPLAPEPGQLWWRSDPDGVLYIRYDDGTSAQWVAAAPQGGAAAAPISTFTITGPVTFVGTEAAGAVCAVLSILPSALPDQPFDWMCDSGATSYAFAHNVGGTGQPRGTPNFNYLNDSTWETIASFSFGPTQMPAGIPTRLRGSGNALSGRIRHYDPAVNTAGLQFQLVTYSTMPTEAATFTLGVIIQLVTVN